MDERLRQRRLWDMKCTVHDQEVQCGVSSTSV